MIPFFLSTLHADVGFAEEDLDGGIDLLRAVRTDFCVAGHDRAAHIRATLASLSAAVVLRQNFTARRALAHAFDQLRPARIEDLGRTRSLAST